LSTLAVHAFIVWNEFWQEILKSKELESLKEEWRLMGKVIDLYHFKGNTKVYIFM